MIFLKGVFQQFDKINRNPTSYWKEVQKTFKRKVKIKKIFNE